MRIKGYVTTSATFFKDSSNGMPIWCVRVNGNLYITEPCQRIDRQFKDLQIGDWVEFNSIKPAQGQQDSVFAQRSFKIEKRKLAPLHGIYNEFEISTQVARA